MRQLLAFLALWCSAVASAEPDLQQALDRHLRTDVPYWMDEPRLRALLRDKNAEHATLDEARLAALGTQWAQQHAADEGVLVDHVASRFASKFFDEVVLRMDGAYGTVVALDRRGIVVAASSLPERYWLGDAPAVALLEAHPDAPWAQDGRPVTGGGQVGVAMPVTDPDTGERLGTLLLGIDAARLARAPAGAFVPDLVGAVNEAASPVIR